VDTALAKVRSKCCALKKSPENPKNAGKGVLPAFYPSCCATGMMAATADRKSLIVGSSLVIETLSAQSSGLAIKSGGRPKFETPNGLGSEFIFGAPRQR
jgi:hypothetical protein